MPIAKALKRGAKLALLMLIGAATGGFLGIGALLTPAVTTKTAGLVAAECALIDAMVGAGAGLVVYLGSSSDHWAAICRVECADARGHLERSEAGRLSRLIRHPPRG